jgi:glycosyltransferase involved in cell wall biosynthesis
LETIDATIPLPLLRFCSTASRYALPHARVLAGALAEHHPESRLAVLVLGDTDGSLREDEPFDVIWPHELAPLTADVDLTFLGWADFATVLRPWLMRLLMERGADTVVHLEADIDVLASLEPVLALVRDSGVVLMPRTPEGLPQDDLEPSDWDLLATGPISPAVVAVRATELGQHFLHWWSERLSETGASLEPTQPQATNLVDPTPALSSWLDVADAVLGPGLGRLEDPGIGLSFWNLHARALTTDGDERFAAGRPLRCVHFSGFRPDRPYWLSERGTRARVLDDPVLTGLCASYAHRLLSAGWVNPERRSDRGGRLADGSAYDARLRRLHARAEASGVAFGDIFSAAGSAGFLSWLQGPAERGAEAGVNQYLYDVYLRRSDLQEALPQIDGPDGERLIAWAWEHGRVELELQPSLLPGQPGPSADRPLGVSVVGHLTESLGLGQAARLYVAALGAADVPVATVGAPMKLPVGRASQQRLAGYGRQPFDAVKLPYDPPFTLLCVNPDGLPELLKQDPGLLSAAQYTIGQWGWETDVIPRHWLPMFERVDELWAYSRYTADMLSRWSPVPVVTVPLPVVVPLQDAQPPFDFGSDFVFLFTFDFFSTAQRKNPAGVVDAFMRAFAPGAGPRLVLKSMNGDFRPAALDALRWRIGDRPDIELIDQHVTPGAYGALLARSNCFVSLHRAEGFGLTIAESMALGKPVIATGYSGNLDFMTPANSYLVDYELTQVGPNAEHYPAQGTWADPDLDHAAALMRHVWEDQDEAIRRGERAARDVSERFSPQVVGRIARARLELLAKSVRTNEGGRRESAVAQVEFEEIERNLAVDLDRSVSAHPGFARLARRGVLRAMRPVTRYQRRLDEAIVEQLRRLSARVGSEPARHDRQSARVRRLEARVSSLERTPANGQPAAVKAPERLDG